MTISNTPIASGVFDIVMEKLAEVSRGDGCVWYSPEKICWCPRFFHDYQTHPSPWLTSAGFSMTISNTSIASTDFSRFFHDYIKHTHRFDWFQQVFLSVFDIVMEKPAEVSWRGVCLT
jgi:hypothetical protein